MNFIKSHLRSAPKRIGTERCAEKAEELLETLKRAQKEPKASPKKKLMNAGRETSYGGTKMVRGGEGYLYNT